jgi:CubicO group peptidase (beta-lactamase class C family)
MNEGVAQMTDASEALPSLYTRAPHDAVLITRRAAVAGLALASNSCSAPPSRRLSDEQIPPLLKRYVGKRADRTGIAVVVSDRSGSRIFVHGHSGDKGNRLVDAETVFEIQSITKVLTAILLADMVDRGEVAFSDPVARYLPTAVQMPVHGRPITLLDLATYTSGLPNNPDVGTLRDKDPATAMANYSAAELYEYISAYQSAYDPGTHYEYANIGFGLLGLALAHRKGTAYETLLIERVCKPLGLTSTAINLPTDTARRMAQGHDRKDNPTSPSVMPAFEGSGAVRSTARDMAVILEACLGFRKTPLDAAFKRTAAMRRPTGIDGTDVGLGWFVSEGRTDRIVWKSGLSSGFNSTLAYSPVNQRGAVVLSNSNHLGIENILLGPANSIDIGFRLTNPSLFPGARLNKLM